MTPWSSSTRPWVAPPAWALAWAWACGAGVAALLGHLTLVLWADAAEHGVALLVLTALVGSAVAVVRMPTPVDSRRAAVGFALVGLPLGALLWCVGFVLGLVTGVYDFQWI